MNLAVAERIICVIVIDFLFVCNVQYIFIVHFVISFSRQIEAYDLNSYLTLYSCLGEAGKKSS